MGHNVRINHAAVAAAARARRGAWMFVGVYPSAEGARGAVRRIPRAKMMPAYEPSGDFEAYCAPHEDGGTAVWARYVGGLPKVEPRPSTMTYRVCDRGAGSAYVGLKIVTVTIAFECPVCGGPRGKAEPYRFFDDGDWRTADRWRNGCGHVDMYSAVLAEYRQRMQVIEAAERKAAARSAAARPRSAGEYTDAVALLKAAAEETPGLHAKQAAVFLDMRGHREPARRIQEELVRNSGRMSARQAIRFLVDLAADRAACIKCREDRANYRVGAGEVASPPCSTCRRDTDPSA